MFKFVAMLAMIVSSLKPGPPWPHDQPITYSVDLDGLFLAPEMMDYSIERALDEWASAVPHLEFVRVDSNADLIFQAALIDGPGGVLACVSHVPMGWSYAAPVIIRFDAMEHWHLDLFSSVATHEIGHALGLFHSCYHEDVMFGFAVDQWKPLTERDVERIQRLYRRP